MDYLDILIMKELRKNCRMSLAMFARERGISPSTVKKRLQKIVNEGLISRYVVQLNFKAINADKILFIIEIGNIENRDSFAESIGANLIVENVGSLDGDRYLIHAACRGLEDLAEINRHLNSFPEIQSIKFDSIESESYKPIKLTKMQLEVLDCLISNPRMRSSEVAARIHRSSKGVQIAIRQLASSRVVNFTAQCHFSTYFVEATYHDGRDNLEAFCESVSEVFPTLWEVLISSMKPVVYLMFATENLNDISIINRELQGIVALESFESAICEPLHFFESIRDDMLKQIIAGNANLLF